MICNDCQKGEMIESEEKVRYEESGLSNIDLHNIKVRKCPECGNKLVSIPQIEGLHRAIAIYIIDKQERLIPEEITFLRKSLGYSKKDLADKIRVRPEQVGRWENTEKSFKMALPIEVFFRSIVAHGQKIENYQDHMDEVAVSEPNKPSLFCMVFSRKSWKMDLANCA